MPQIRFADDNGRLFFFALEAEPFTIGRSPTAQLHIDDDRISREHTRIERTEEGRYKVRDLGSRNKTFVNGQMVTEAFLAAGDVIRVGERVIEFVEDTATGESVPTDFLTPDRSEPTSCEWLRMKAPIPVTTQQVELLARLGGFMPAATRPADVASHALSQLMSALQAERGFIALKGEKKMELHVLTQRGIRKTPGGALTPVSQAFVFHAMLQNCAGRYPEKATYLEEDHGYAATAIAAPLISNGDVIGVVYADRPAAKKAFVAAQLTYIAAAGAHIGGLLAEAARRFSQSGTRETQAWMRTVQRVRRNMQPDVEAPEGFVCAFRQIPGQYRCGDLVDLVSTEGNRLALVLIDGGGGGVMSLAQASALQLALRATIAANDDALMDPSAILCTLSTAIHAQHAVYPMACTYVGLDVAVGRGVYINAGGCPPLFVTGPGRLITLDQVSLLPGSAKQVDYEVSRFELPDSFRLVLHTDGLVHATNAAGEPMGDQKVHAALLDQKAFTNAEGVLERVVTALTTHSHGVEPADDVTILVLSRS